MEPDEPEPTAEAARRSAAKRRDDERWLFRRFLYRSACVGFCAAFAGLHAWFMCGGSVEAGVVDGVAAGICSWIVLRWSLSTPWSLTLFCAIILIGGFGLGALLPPSAQELAYGLRWPFAATGLIVTSLLLGIVMHLHDDEH